VVERGDRASAELVIVELAVYRASGELRRDLVAALAARGDESLLSRFRETWLAEGDDTPPLE
jgi:hypothetical protein